MEQLDIYGNSRLLAGIIPLDLRDAHAPTVQPRLFEPQMEGQMTLESGTAATKDGRAGATTGSENRRDG